MPRATRFILPAALLAMASVANAANNQILAWNNLGMHCMDSDYSVFSILPPYNTIEAQLIVNGKLVKTGTGYTVTYQAVADATGSFNSTAMGKGNFYTYAKALFGPTLAPEGGLAGWSMPGPTNNPQNMLFEPLNQPAAGVFTPVNWWRAEGIPISPYDDAHAKNPYPLMRVIARNGGGTVIATNDIVLPVSDEMDCRACHASGTQDGAEPAAGWVWNGLPERDFRLNILRLHDEHQFARHSALYTAALADRGFNPQGLYRSVVADHKPVLCAACHASEALGTPSFGTIPQLTTSVHAYHAHVEDPVLHTTLDDSANRAACYRCHPGSTTKCLRGAMGGAIATDGSMEMQCQSCHGNMSAVGASTRVGWFMEPTCQNCHTGTATHNNGLIRYTSAFDTNGLPRVPVDTTFATTPNTPASGLDLYRFSVGHGGLQCSACHGSTHAEFPSTHANDNRRNVALQGHAGTMIECASCHVSVPASTAANVRAGPHGMHPISQDWVDNHHDLVRYPETTAQCQDCHGVSYHGTVLSRAQQDRSWSAYGTTISFPRGAQIGCYNCHSGPDEGNQNPSIAPTAGNVAASTANHQSVTITLPATGVGLTLRIISQPANGSVGLVGKEATYFPNPGFVGTDTFTFAAFDGAKNSNLGTVTVTVGQGPYSIAASAQIPPTYPAGWPTAFAVVPTLTNTVAVPSFDWDFGDGTAHGTSQFPSHTYAAPGTYHWSAVATADGATTTVSGTIVIGDPVVLGISQTGTSVTLSWPRTLADTLLETSADLGATSPWQWVPDAPGVIGNSLNVTLPASGQQFFRVDRPW
ncbi:MAG: PKD domain-containing protein [Verrucomicrobia bacterium]|nr:PKD domain-containing protein [Verrucomicrobiota bacterium]